MKISIRGRKSRRSKKETSNSIQDCCDVWGSLSKIVVTYGVDFEV